MSIQRNKVNLRDFPASDDSAAFALAMDYLREHPYTTLVVDPGTYTLTSELARETQRAVMAGEYGFNPQRTMFNPKFAYTRGICFAGQKGTRLEAYGVTLMVDGFMEPVSVRDCEDVTVCGLTIDHKRKPYSRAIITKIESESEDGKNKVAIAEFDENSAFIEKTPRFLRSKYYDAVNEREIFPVLEDEDYLDSRHLRLYYTRAEKLKEGIEYYTVHTYHSRPAVLIENAKNITLEDVTINSQPGMGVVGNRSENVTLRRLSVVPSIGHHFSTNTDGTHFTSMKGLLRFENCFFDCQGDDFVNVHNYYHAIVKREGDCVCYMQEKTPDGTHAQSLDYPDVGDTLELTSRSTMALIDTFKVLECVPMPDEWMCKVVLDHPLPSDTENLVLADVTRLPRVEVIGCCATCHHARSILIKTRNVLIENNTFRNVHGSAIHIAPEASWYEGVSPADVVIRGNRIIRCAEDWHDDMGAGIMVYADADDANNCCIKNITIEDNFIEVPYTSHGIYVRNVDGLRIARNKIISQNEPVFVSICENVSIEE